MSSFNSRWLSYAPADEKLSETARNTTDETDKSHDPTTAPALKVVPSTDSVPRLPWQLERLVSAACADVLPKGTVTLPSGFVTDLNRYVLGCGCGYLVSDREEAERRLWQAHRAWRGVN